MYNNIKYGMLGRPLELFKTHDFCASGKPKLTVVLIHGIASDSSSFKKTLDYLEGTTSLKDARFVTFDLLGAGKSYTSDKLKYNFNEQLTALENSIKKLKPKTPLVLVGHSMGTLIATRFADSHRRLVKELILVSPPIYTPKDFENPEFIKAQEMVKIVMQKKNPEATAGKAFGSVLENIVLNRKNYEVLCRTTKPTKIIYGDKDEIIAAFNVPKVLKTNPKITAVKTVGGHSMSHDKYVKVLAELERILNEAV
ncbi:MAG: alpha/beta hydrolase [Candidatus Saccharibacteria bacterium]|nr:alpha/beta hydrolase [Candidatus Saccharibacteria bacterium]